MKQSCYLHSNENLVTCCASCIDAERRRSARIECIAREWIASIMDSGIREGSPADKMVKAVYGTEAEDV